MSDDVINVLFKKLDKVCESISELKEDIAEIKTEVAVMKAKLEEKEKRCEAHSQEMAKIENRVTVLENTRSEFMGAKALIAWLITTGIAIFSAIKDHIFK